MPRSRRTGKSRVQDWRKYRVLLTTGWDFFGDLGTDHPPWVELRQAWGVLRESILAEFAAEPKRRAGVRPYGFWIFEVGLDRRPSDEEQRNYLEERGLLTQTERRVLNERTERTKQL